MLTGELGHAVGYVIDDVEARNILQVEEVNRLRLLLTENGNQHVAAGHFLLAARLHMENRALQHPLKTQRGLYVGIVVERQQRCLLFDKLGELPPQLCNIRIARLENFVNLGDIQQRQQQVFDRHELVTLIARPLERLVKTKF